MTELDIGTDACASDLFFIWPMIVSHRIDETSPFYNLSAADMLQEKFEIVVILEGTIESTGQSTQARSSYLNMEILWGHRFLPVVGYNNERQGYDIDYSKFNETLPVDTPLCSGRELAEFYKMQEGMTTPSKWNAIVVIKFIVIDAFVVDFHVVNNLYFVFHVLVCIVYPI